MFYGQCWTCGERWELGTAPTCKCKGDDDDTMCYRSELEAAVKAEREACAALLEENAMACENPIYRSLLQANAHAIREMGQP
jgi:hypothetical protein